MTIFSPLLGFVALAAIVVSCVALRQIAVNSDRMSGRSLAVLGVILPCLFLGWGLGCDVFRRERVIGYARQFADDWLQILNRKEPYVAHQFRVARKWRMDPTTNLEVEYQRDEGAVREFSMFVSESPVKDILEGAPKASFQFEEAVKHEQAGLVDTVILQYLYETPACSKRHMWITVQRTYSSLSQQADWSVIGVSVTKPAG